MCGICGTYAFDGAPDRRAVERMSSALSHRGPDDEGFHADGPAALGFRRLSILDLEGGHQPMASPDGRYTIVFNGEIYNHPELKAEFEAAGMRYKTHSDTETLLHAFQRHGREALKRLRGMFAIALWDRSEGRLLLARDPVGIKPLYYSRDEGRLNFASELRALVRGGASREIDPAALEDYLSYGYVHAPRTILASVKKLEPGQWMEIDAGGVRFGRFHEITPAAPSKMSVPECEDRLEELLTKAVRSHLLSDVPVGAFLSGGVDSSLVAALMAERGPVETFSIGFSGTRPGLDESAHARRVAAHIGSRHHELILPASVLDRMGEAVASLDEPLADSAVLPTYLLSSHARRRVKVVLAGEGADELFAGYDRYKAAYFSGRVASWPSAFKSLALTAARAWGRGSAYKNLPIESPRDWARARRAGERGHLLGFLTPQARAGLGDGPDEKWLEALAGLSGLNGVLAYDVRTILVDNLLMKVDKASMKASLEARVPFLDLDLIEFAMSIPPEFKIRHFKGKWILRRLAGKRLPAPIARRRKHGFWAPWEEWISSPNAALDDALEDLAASGLFDARLLGESLARLRAGSRREDPGLLYRIAMLALWRADLESHWRPA